MSRKIHVSEDVYSALERERGNRSFDDVIRDLLDRGLRIEDVSGTGVLNEGPPERRREDADRGRRRTQFEEGFGALSDVDFESIDDPSFENHRR